MADKAAHSGYSIEVSGFPTGRVIEYSLMEDYSSFKNFKPISNQQKIMINKNDHVLIIRYKCDNPDAKVPDGFEVEPVTGKVSLIPHQFTTRKDSKGQLWSYCVFQVTLLFSSEKLLSSHDSDVKPPEPPIP